MTSTKPGSPNKGSRHGVRLSAVHRALAESQAQCRTAQSRIEVLAQRNARLERHLIELARSEQQARRLAYHDALTGLANRALLQDRLRQAISQAQRGRRLVAVLLIDLDGFKCINDRLGHAAGDDLLRAVAARLSASIRAADTACRHGGDEFVILLPEVDSPAMVAAVVAKVHARICEPHLVDRHELRVTASIGSALCPAHGSTYEQLMRHADVGMYLAKAASRPAAVDAWRLSLAAAESTYANVTRPGAPRVVREAG
jgi:diguanylate cyclase (GGDEF)-like protein